MTRFTWAAALKWYSLRRVLTRERTLRWSVAGSRTETPGPNTGNVKQINAGIGKQDRKKLRVPGRVGRLFTVKVLSDLYIVWAALP